MTDFIITQALGVMTGLRGDAARSVGNIRVADGIITEIGLIGPRPGERVVDASGCVVLPGLINTHHHLMQSVLKAIPEGMNESLAAWLRLVPYSYWHRLDEAAMRVAVTIGLAELALSGATTVAEHHYLYSDDYDYDPNEILFEVAEQFGLRFVLCRGGATKARAFDTAEIRPLPTETLDQVFNRTLQSVKRWHDPAPDAMRRVVMAPTTPTYSLYPEELREIASFARSHGLRLHSHLSENQGYVDFTLEHYGKRPVEWLRGHDWLGPDVWFAHLVACDVHEVALLAETQTGMAHCPQANARLGSGIAPADELARLGGRVSLAVDGAAANEAADMASALYAAFSLHRASKGVDSVRAEEVLHWATVGGAQVLGLPAIGSLQVGMAADLALWDLSNPRYLGQHDRLIGPVISGGQAQIRHSFVAGREIVSHGRVPWLDMQKLAHDAARVVTHIQNTL